MGTIKSTQEDQRAVPPPAEAIPLPTHHIDNAFIWQQLSDINRGLGRIESSVANLSERTEKLETKVSAVKDHLNRIVWASIGGGAVIATIISGAVTALKYFGKI